VPHQEIHPHSRRRDHKGHRRIQRTVLGKAAFLKSQLVLQPAEESADGAGGAAEAAYCQSVFAHKISSVQILFQYRMVPLPFEHFILI
jgi:hypothetical protein